MQTIRELLRSDHRKKNDRNERPNQRPADQSNHRHTNRNVQPLNHPVKRSTGGGRVLWSEVDSRRRFFMIQDDLSHITTTDWIMHASAMPVCLHGDRLTFVRDVVLSAEVVPGMELIREEKAGDSWDGASIPRFMWSIIGHPLEEQFRWASFWHDRLCEQSTLWADRRLADAVLLVLLELYGVAYWRRTAMWAAVRLYAWTWWSWRAWR